MPRSGRNKLFGKLITSERLYVHCTYVMSGIFSVKLYDTESMKNKANGINESYKI